MSKPSYRRRQMVVDRPFQFRFLFLCLSVAIAVIAFVCFFIFVMSVATSSTWVQQLNTRLLVGFGIFIVLNGLVLGLVSIVLTHRVAGPTFRLNQCLDSLLQGDLEVRIQVREKDYLQDVTDKLSKLRDVIKAERGAIKEALSELEKAQSSGDSAAIAAARDHLSKIARIGGS
ncbi:MAG: hypothetical protein ACYTAF_11900 [Planctomycetota bacterium]|jgi:nitrogen fixation/metabolism regulation signal transduction histidine kinase